MLRPLALVFTALLASTALAQQRPNIVLIVSDDHAVAATGCYGSKLNPTPAIDRIAAAGARFPNSFVTNSLCGPSRACILTGKYTHANGFPDNQRGRQFDGSQLTFPKLLQAAGYETAIFGKWHLGSDPTGFDRWEIIQGVAKYFDPSFRNTAGTYETKGYSTDTIFNLAEKFLNDRDRAKPFFLMITPNAPHRNWTTDEKHAAMFTDREVPVPPTFDDDLATRTRAAHEARLAVADLRKTDVKLDPPPSLTEQQLKHWKYQLFIKDYLRTVAAMDDRIGQLLDHLNQSGLAANTLVIYTSDNGFFLGEHGWFDKRFMYEPSLRVPLVMSYPGVIPARSTPDAMALNIDLAPTILDFAGVAVPPEIHGQSLRPILTGESAPTRDSIYYHYYEQEAEHNVAPHYGVRTRTHKLIHFYTHNQWELYDLANDPDELRNLYDDPKQTLVRQQLVERLEQWRRELADDTP